MNSRNVVSLSVFLILSIIFVFTITTCDRKEKNFEPDFNVVLDKSNCENLLAQPSRIVPRNVSEFFNPTEKEIELLHQSFKDVLTLKSESDCSKGRYVEKLEDYLYQYVGLSIGNERFVYVNAANRTIPFIEHLNWELVPVVVSDGGIDYWGVLFNLESKKFSMLAINCSV